VVGSAVTYRHHDCVTIHCDNEPIAQCDSGWEETTFHFDDEPQALRFVLSENGCDWTRRPDGRLLCRACSETADCADRGHHLYDQWSHPGYYDHALRVWIDDTGVIYRRCTHCGGGLQEHLTALGAIDAD
jgi:hypothetical protein